MAEKKRILVVDDEEDTLFVIKSFLEANNFDVTSAKNGALALDSVLKLPPDAIVLDIMMPVMDGFTLTKKLRQDEKMKDIPVIITTAKTKMKEIFNNNPEIAVNSILEKPFRLKTLVEMLNRILA